MFLLSFWQASLANEKNMLAGQVKKLLRDVAKLETFKRTLMQSLQEDDENPTGEGGDKRGVANSNLAIRRASRKLLLHQSKFRKELYSFCSINDLKCWRGVHFVRKTKLYHDAQSFESSAP
jgi:hypothetical protein